MNWKKSFLAANPPDEFSTNRIKKYPKFHVKYTAGSLMLWACFYLPEVLNICSDSWHHGFYQIPTDKKSKPDCLCKKSYNGPCLDLPPGQQSKTNIKINTKMGHWAQNEYFTMAVSVLWPEPYRKWVRWTEEKKHRHGAVNLKYLERFWMKKWSLITYQVFSKVFRHYRRKLRAVTLGKGRCNNWVPIIVANINSESIYFTMRSPAPLSIVLLQW